MPLERTETALGSTIGCLVDQSMSDELQAPQQSNKREIGQSPVGAPGLAIAQS